MRVLCFDISSGGFGRAVFDEDLAASDVAEISWEIRQETDGAAVLPLETLRGALRSSMNSVVDGSVDAISFSGFMHSSVLLDAYDRALTPVFTWMDRRGSEAVEMLRREFGSQFHQKTGCRFHPMFPVFKAATFRPQGLRRVVSAKSVLIAELTGAWIEDHGSASASGFYNTRTGEWDLDLLRAIDLDPSALPPLVERHQVIGKTAAGIPVAAGSGDGFLANLGSGCDDPRRLAITLGTSASVRRVLPHPVFAEAAGTFCYRAQANGFLLGCASNNGGNVLDWGRSVFTNLPEAASQAKALPTFIPLLSGERSPEWDAFLTGSWHGLQSYHTAEDLAYSIVDGVVFNLAHYVEILQTASGQGAAQAVLSGNGFLNVAACETIAAVLDAEVVRPADQGLASLRGAAVCGFQALGVDVTPALQRLMDTAERLPKADTPQIRERYARYRAIRK
jgi:gluconokinase